MFGEILNYFSFLDCKKNLKIELIVVGKMYCVCALLKKCTQLFNGLWFLIYWTTNIGRVFYIRTFYRANLVVENVFAEPRRHSCWERFYMIVNPVLPLYRNQPINLQWKSIHWFLYNGNRGLKLVAEIKDSWNLLFSNKNCIK